METLLKMTITLYVYFVRVKITGTIQSMRCVVRSRPQLPQADNTEQSTEDPTSGLGPGPFKPHSCRAVYYDENDLTETKGSLRTPITLYLFWQPWNVIFFSILVFYKLIITSSKAFSIWFMNNIYVFLSFFIISLQTYYFWCVN